MASTATAEDDTVAADEARGDDETVAAAGRVFGEVVTKEDLARELGRTKRTINMLIARGELPRPLKLGQKMVWLKPTLERWLRDRADRAAE